MDNGQNEIDIKRYELGPGIKHAIIWISIISSFAAGWYIRGEFTQGELATADLIQLKSDIVDKAESRADKDKNQKGLDELIGGKGYDKDCGDKPISTFYN